MMCKKLKKIQNKFKSKVTSLWMENPGISGLYMLTGIYIGKPGLAKQQYLQSIQGNTTCNLDGNGYSYGCYTLL